MKTKTFPLEKIFGSRTRIKIITLFTTGVNRPYYVREISRNINERLNAVRRELEILQKIGMLNSHMNKRRKYYVVDNNFFLLDELASIMQKAGPGINDKLFKNLEHLPGAKYVCASGYFTGAKDSPTDILVVGNINENKLATIIKIMEEQLEKEVIYTPMAENEFKYRINFNDVFLRTLFAGPYKELINKLDSGLQPTVMTKAKVASN